MAAGTITLSDFACKYLLNGTADLDGATVKAALVGSGWTPDQVNHDTWADASANEIANGNGYSTGGVTLGTLAIAAVTKGYKWSSADATWTASGSGIPAWRYFVIYLSGTYNGVVDPIIGWCLGDSTPADVPLTTAGNQVIMYCPAGGWLDLTRP